jgi:hypothetical protein
MVTKPRIIVNNFGKLLTNTHSWSKKFVQKPQPEPMALAFQNFELLWSGCNFGSAWPDPQLEAGPCTSLLTAFRDSHPVSDSVM